MITAAQLENLLRNGGADRQALADALREVVRDVEVDSRAAREMMAEARSLIGDLRREVTYCRDELRQNDNQRTVMFHRIEAVEEAQRRLGERVETMGGGVSASTWNRWRTDFGRRLAVVEDAISAANDRESDSAAVSDAGQVDSRPGVSVTVERPQGEPIGLGVWRDVDDGRRGRRGLTVGSSLEVRLASGRMTIRKVGIDKFDVRLFGIDPRSIDDLVAIANGIRLVVDRERG